ncbi:HAMP domain-containing sensor histidine kinase [Marinicella sp. S1101]|uniref:sensor histidine kinase n=1 Tax=Marinicella marina TaxID=2996016 RepID=UPI002260CC6A|nr:HAMP domain-containing sensor histidine kinase [Marinicella marina]MCX7554696.1 HAMP domain-containing sensor histidine kinase [Marinicella marina]MDJ1141488.1 HAMP domain-containing sensor histidine kinase [Marinicella marina]
MVSTNQTTSLKNIIIRNFIGFAVFSALLFSAVNFTIAYSIEDEYFNLHLQAEADYLAQHHAEHGVWPKPRFSYMTFYATSTDFPDEINRILAEEPQRVELKGANGRYFHIHRFNQHKGPFLISEVSDMLMVRSHTRFIITALIIIAALVTLLAVYFAFRLAMRTAKPMSQLADSVALLKPNKLPEDFPSNQPENEVRQLAKAIQQLITRVTFFISREQHFTRDVSHELRTPIAVVKSSVELLLQQAGQLNKQQLETLRQIDFACVQMEQTVVTLLSLAREKTQQPVAAIKLLPVVEKVVLQQSTHLQDKAVDVVIDVTAEAQLLMQEAELVILLSNLVGNAFQHSQEGNVTIRFQGSELTITDTGKGIDPALQPHVKEPLIKGADSSGFGIGLSLVNRLCEHQNIFFEISSNDQVTTASLKNMPIK